MHDYRMHITFTSEEDQATLRTFRTRRPALLSAGRRPRRRPSCIPRGRHGSKPQEKPVGTSRPRATAWQFINYRSPV